jgi:hypothetical protein
LLGSVREVISLGPELDMARARVVEHGLVPDAIGRLNAIVTGLSLDALGPVKQQLKRFFSQEPWTDADDQALAAAIGDGGDGNRSGGDRHELEPGLTLVWGWDAGPFRLRIESADVSTPDGDAASPAAARSSATDLGATFDAAVVPEATPSPRTIRFATPPLHDGPSRIYGSKADAVGDPPAARLFAEFDEVTNVLVGPDFVAVTIARPDHWEELLGPILRVVDSEFAHAAPEAPRRQAPVTLSLSAESTTDDEHEPRRLERAWSELGVLRADRAEDLDRIVAASRDDEPARRQVAAALLDDAPPEVASSTWQRLLDDPSRIVRRSAVDAIAGAGREDLRPLLEHALDDTDAWIRWKALHGIAALGGEASKTKIDHAAKDADFRVRLEAARLLRAPAPGV